MIQDVLIRTELASDHDEIREVTRLAFLDKAFSDGTEAPLIDDLRQAGVMTVSLVATIDQKLVGHVAFSPVTINGIDMGWFGLGPVSVLPQLQKQGNGTRLINQGLEDLKQRDANGCVLVGDPNYYARFGFQATSLMKYRPGLEKHFQILSFQNDIPLGQVEFHESFGE